MTSDKQAATRPGKGIRDMGQVASIEQVRNGFLVKANGAMYVAVTILDVASVLEDEVFAPEPEFVTVHESAPVMSLGELENVGVVRRGSDFAASNDVENSEPAIDEERRWPCAEDGSEYPAVTFEGGRYTVACPVCGPTRAEFKPSASMLRCQGKPGGKPCRVAVPKDAVERIVALGASS